ncbi:MAG: hypothetical protein KKE36_04040 [Actinobacteria bacterium]|nr:hypothetical protein [Actinomycetota bacterium]
MLLVVGIAVLFLLFFLRAAKHGTYKLAGRTIREFTVDDEIWTTVDSWAMERKYELSNQTETARVYTRRGPRTPVLVPSLEIARTNNRARLESWLGIYRVGRIVTFGIYPDELRIDVKSLWISYGDWYPLDPRHIARDDVNTLLDMLDAKAPRIPQCRWQGYQAASDHLPPHSSGGFP